MAPALEVADIFRRHGEAFRQAHAGHLGRVERRVMGAITACRTAALGGHVEQCDDCGATRIAYNSCRNRHCPKCQGLARAQWLAERQAELLPVPYFHVVFTLPAPAGEIAFQNKAIVYAILFRAAAETLATIAADPRHLGAQARRHRGSPYLGPDPAASSAHPLRRARRRPLARRHTLDRLPARLLPAGARALAVCSAACSCESLQNAFDAGKLRLLRQSRQPCRARSLRHVVSTQLRRIDWVVYAKPPFGGPEQVLAYLGRYTHRVAIANSRLISLSDGKVRFAWKDYRQDGKTKVMTLDADEFIRRFLLHTLPDGFHRIRHYGFLANGGRSDNIALCRQTARCPSRFGRFRTGRTITPEAIAGSTPSDFAICPECGGTMRRIAVVPRSRHQPFSL